VTGGLFGREIVMLVLTRKTGERIQMGEDIIIEIRQIDGKRVALALDAPKSVRILRGELLTTRDSAICTSDEISGLPR
jgi:carbon storage regulator CsrA